jgi:YD repeat-containing protein
MMQTVKTYDNLNRLLMIESTTGGRPVSSHTYQLNDANQRTKRTDADNSYWDYAYDSLGQVTNAVRRWSDGVLVAGQQYGYQFDDIGNRKKSTQDSGLGTQDSVSLGSSMDIGQSQLSL